MDQHPVPQNISSYEFRLVGDMTLKQFLQLAGGCIAGLVFYRLPLPFFIKYPLIFFSVLIGILMAFVPIQGRPFTQWVMAFIRAVYSPTEFFWRPDAITPKIAVAPSTPIPPPISISTPPPVVQTPPPPPVVASVKAAPPPPPVTQPATPLSPLDVAQVKSPLTSPPPPAPIQTDYVRAATPPPASLSVEPAKVEVPKEKPLPPPPPAPTPAVRQTPLVQSTNVPLTPIVPHTPDQNLARQGEVSSSLPPPEAPNILSGQVLTFDSQSIEGAIVEIVDTATGIPVRALRTNRAGLFQIATPLPASSYSIYTDKEGFSFEPVSVAAVGKIISPIIVRAKDHA